MSTPSRIILKVRKEDVGRKIKFDPTKLPIPLKEWIETDENGKVWLDQRGKDLCRVVTLKGGYIGIYCHWDGYETGVGHALKEKFSDYRKALNLLAGGWCSAISSDHIKHYANRKGEEWKVIKPVFGDTPQEIMRNVGNNYKSLKFKVTLDDKSILEDTD
jgi:hypothetical protein